MVDFIRVSEASGALLGLWSRKLSAKPTTCYLMTYLEGKCSANCLFCPQSRSSVSDSDKLSRVSWPECDFEVFEKHFSENQEKFKRICIQALNYPGVVEDLCEVAFSLKEISGIPLSVSCQPLVKDDMKKLKKKGVDRLGIPIDGATPEVFDSIKGRSAGGPYRWERSIEALEKAVEVFDGEVSTHLIVGLGESDEEMLKRIQFFKKRGVEVALFAFTPIKGSVLEDKKKPTIDRYRRIQLAKYLIEEGLVNFNDMSFENGNLTSFGFSSNVLRESIISGDPFLTSGCPGCNRPYYNETPLGPVYNFPEEPSSEDLKRILGKLESIF